MGDRFDPYYTWLGIPPREQPPNHYRLLSLELFEDNADVISHAADRQMLHVRTFQTGRHAALSQRILNELAAARACLLDPEEKAAYDRRLSGRRSQDSRLPAPPPLPHAAVASARIEPPRVPVRGPAASGSANGTAAADSPEIFTPATTHPAHAFRPLRRRRRRSPAPVVLGVMWLLLLAAMSGIVAAYYAGWLNPSRNTVAQQTRADATVNRRRAAPAGEETASPDTTKSKAAPKNPAGGRMAPHGRAGPESDANAHVTVGVSGDEAASPRQRTGEESTPHVEVSLTTESATMKVPSTRASSSEATAGPISRPASGDSEASSVETVSDSVERGPAPTGEALDRATSDFADRFADTIAKVKTPRQKAALAAILIKEAADTRASAATQYVMLEAAYRCAIEAGDFGNARRAVDAMILGYDIDAAALRARLLTDGAAMLSTPDVYREVAQAALDEIPRLLAARRFEEARQVVDKTRTVITRRLDGDAAQAPLRKRIDEAAAEIIRQQALWNSAMQARARLREDSGDAAAHLVLGRYLCGFAGNWPAGLDHLTRTADTSWKSAADRDLATPTSAEEQLAAADAWYDLGRRNREFPGLLARARRWYERAQPDAPADRQSHIKQRIDDLLARSLDAWQLAQAALPSTVATAEAREPDRPARSDALPSAGAPAGAAPAASTGPRLQVSVDLKGVLHGHTGSVRSLAFSADGRQLASVGDDAALRLWDADKGSPTAILTIKAHDTEATHVAQGRATALLATGGDRDGRPVVALWDHHLDRRSVLGGPTSELLCPAFLPGDKTLAVATGDHFVKAIDLEGEVDRVFHAHDAPVRAVAVSQLGDVLASADEAGRLKLYNLTAGRPTHSIDAHEAPIVAVAISANSQRVATATSEGEVRIHDTTIGHHVASFSAGPASALAFLADGLGIAVAGDKQLTFWDARHGTRRAVLPAHDGRITALAVSPEGRQMATGGDDRTVKLWKITRRGGK